MYFGPLFVLFSSARRLLPSSKTRVWRGLAPPYAPPDLKTPDSRRGKLGRLSGELFGRGWGERERRGWVPRGRTRQAGTRPPEGKEQEAGAPAGPGRRGLPRGGGPTRLVGAWDEPEVAAEAGSCEGGGGWRSTWATWQPFRGPRDPSPFSRPPALSELAAERLLFPGPTASGSVSPPGVCRASPPQPPLLTSPAPCLRAHWRRRERAADRVAHSTTRPWRPRPLLAPGEVKAAGGKWSRGSRVRVP